MENPNIQFGPRGPLMEAELTRLRRHNATHAALPWVLGADCVLRAGVLSPLSTDWSFVGQAVTVEMDYVDHQTALLAAERCRAGDVLVISVCETSGQSVWGSGLTRVAKSVGIAAVVIDGAISNRSALIELDLPVYALGATPATGVWEGHGRVNFPITIGSTLINPGDLVAGDSDGVVVIPAKRVGEVAMALEVHAAQVASRLARMAEGVPLSAIRQQDLENQ